MPGFLAARSTFLDSPAPYTSSSLMMKALPHPSSRISVAIAVPWMVSFRTMRTKLRLPDG